MNLALQGFSSQKRQNAPVWKSYTNRLEFPYLSFLYHAIMYYFKICNLENKAG